METLKDFVETMKNGAGFMRGYSPSRIGLILEEELPSSDLDQAVQVTYERTPPCPLSTSGDHSTHYRWEVRGAAVSLETARRISGKLEESIGRAGCVAKKDGFSVYYRS